VLRVLFDPAAMFEGMFVGSAGRRRAANRGSPTLTRKLLSELWDEVKTKALQSRIA
jgi:hypothetical protein